MIELASGKAGHSQLRVMPAGISVENMARALPPKRSTAPVMQQRDADGGSRAVDWTIRFIMPRAWSLQTLPPAKDDRIRLETVPAGTFAVIRFSGFWRDALLRMKTDELRAFLSRKGLSESGSPIYAFYNRLGPYLSCVGTKL